MVILIVIIMSLLTSLLSPVLQYSTVQYSTVQYSSELKFEASGCSTFCIVCDVPSTAVFYSESVECVTGIASKFFFKILFLLFRWLQLQPL